MSEASPRDIPRAGVAGVAGGLILMAVFTTMWGTWAFPGLPLVAGILVAVVFVAIAIVFLVNGIALFRALRRFPRVGTAERMAQTRRFGLRFGIVFGIEGVLIGASGAILGATDNYLLINPVIALIVGAHFIPLARVFERTIDYYIAAWVIAAALVGIGLLLVGAVDPFVVWSIVSVATACGTTAYGVYMLGVKRSILARTAG